MQIAVTDLINEIRRNAKDTGASGRRKWTSLDIITALNEALDMAFSDRPDIFMVSDVIEEAPQVDDEGDVVEIVTCRAALVHGAAAQLLKENAGDKYSLAAADGHMKDFFRILGA